MNMKSASSRLFNRNFFLLWQGLMPLSMGMSGVLADLLNQDIPLLFVICGVLATLMAIVVSLDPEFRKYMAFEVAKSSSTKSQ